jgi:hypothetical protein
MSYGKPFYYTFKKYIYRKIRHISFLKSEISLNLERYLSKKKKTNKPQPSGTKSSEHNTGGIMYVVFDSKSNKVRHNCTI